MLRVKNSGGRQPETNNFLGVALAVGLCKVVKTHRFIATLYMMCDVLPKVFWLICVFQSSTIDLSVLEKIVSSTSESPQLLCNYPGVFTNKLDSDVLLSLS